MVRLLQETTEYHRTLFWGGEIIQEWGTPWGIIEVQNVIWLVV